MDDDPYIILGVDETAGDEDIKSRYLALVRAYPPDREPERFKRYRAAYDALIDEHARLERAILRTSGAALARLKAGIMSRAVSTSSRPSQATIAALLAEGLERF